MRALLDVNVLIALLDASHLHHHPATHWLAAHLDRGWASCPLTQNGCIRILSNPAYPNAIPAAQVAERLAEAAQHPAHAFGRMPSACCNRIAWRGPAAERPPSDGCLPAGAGGRPGRAVGYLDRGVPWAAVRGARFQHLVVLS